MAQISDNQIDKILGIAKAFEPGGRIERMESCVSSLTKGQDQAGEVLRKAFLTSPQGGPGLATVGWDGADQTGLLRLSSKTKAVGNVGGKNFGEWLQYVGKAGCGKIGRAEMDNVCKAYGSGRFDMSQVSKVPNAEGTGAAGGFLVPPQFYAKLLQFVAEKSFIKAMCTTLPMAGATLQFPYLNQKATTASALANYTSSNFFGGVAATWSPEASTAEQTNPAFQQGELRAYTLLCRTLSSIQLIDDSFLALDGLITTLLSDSIAWQLDYAFLRGNGVGRPLGIVNAPGTISATRTGGGSTFTLAAAAGMVSRVVMSDNFNGLVWVMSQSVLPQLIQMVNNTSSNAALVWLNQYAGGATEKFPMKLFGIPIYFTEKCAALGTAGDVMLLDLTKYLCGDRMQIAIESSPWPNFQSYQMTWRAVWRGDGQPWFDGAITLGDGVTTVSPHIILAA